MESCTPVLALKKQNGNIYGDEWMCDASLIGANGSEFLVHYIGMIRGLSSKKGHSTSFWSGLPPR